ncbi:Asp23/Gls24 family envelope stress response protein [Cumulibacter manganitolerans]|uniref:Asp23/Gls24 family envelope stress response protein n=1 Tax=Cumulibacter manganitolerans TaxID=1884992 RepID=UPI001E37DFC5|nr:Asp23/Gls24 family envelope stress response protein [Cumulibacter manganitolerans]
MAIADDDLNAAPAGPVSEGLDIDNGTISVSEAVVAKIAALAAREVAGVHSLGVGAARQVTPVRDRLPGATPSPTSGVSVEVGRTQAAVDLDIVVEYGTPITQIARDVRRHVVAAVERMTGLQVVEVNITVDDVNLPAVADPRDKRLQ